MSGIILFEIRYEKVYNVFNRDKVDVVEVIW